MSALGVNAERVSVGVREPRLRQCEKAGMTTLGAWPTFICSQSHLLGVRENQTVCSLMLQLSQGVWGPHACGRCGARSGAGLGQPCLGLHGWLELRGWSPTWLLVPKLA